MVVVNLSATIRFILLNAAIHHWFNNGYVEEYKKRNSSNDLNNVCLIFILKFNAIDLIFKNVLKILWSSHYMMNVDRRRRFAFGATI